MAILYQKFLPLDRVEANPYQTRLSEDKEHVESLARDILAHGMMQVPAGRLTEDGERVQLAFGHSRLAAYKLLAQLGHEDFQDFPVNIMELDDEQMAIAAWSENEKRRDLNPVERAEAIKRRIIDFRWSQQEVAEKLDIDRTSVSNALRLLRLPVEIQENLKNGILSTRQAMSLMPYYELKPEEMARLEDEYKDDLSEFLQVARNGEISSDAIRERMAEYLHFIRPEEPAELPMIADAEAGIRVINDQDAGERELEISEQAPRENPETSEQVPGEGKEPEISEQLSRDQESALEEETVLQEEPEDSDEAEPVEDDALESAAPAEPVSKPAADQTIKISEKPAPAAVITPTSTPAMMQAAEETTLTITWLKTGGVMIGYRKAGNVIPKLKFINFEEGQTTDVIFAAIEEILVEGEE